MSPDRKTEIVELATEAALFHLTLIHNGVDPISAASMASSWLLSRKLRDENEKDW